MPATVDRPSPNFGARRAGAIDMLVLHYTGMPTAEAALTRLCDPKSGVSCHWLIDEDGTIYRLVNEANRAWHAGIAFWADETDINSRSIGIELVNPGHEFGYREFPTAQMEALADLASGIITRHPIPKFRVLGHADVAPDRKRDPGELFDWAWLADRGIGLFPDFDAVLASAPRVSSARRRLAADRVSGQPGPGQHRRHHRVSAPLAIVPH